MIKGITIIKTNVSMNRLSQYSCIALSTVFALAFGACTEECEYTPARPVADDCIKASFVTDGEATILDANSENKVTVTVNRERTDGEATVSLKPTHVNASFFQVPASVTFAAGQASATFDIPFSTEGMELEEEHMYSVELDESATDPYSENTIAVTSGTVLKQAAWNSSLGEGVFNCALFGPVSCEVRQAEEAANWFKAVAPLQEGCDIVFKVDEDNNVRVRQQLYYYGNVGSGAEYIYVSSNASYASYNKYYPDQKAIQVAMTYVGTRSGTLGTAVSVLYLP